MEKVLIIALDGATFNVIDPLIERGEFPNLQAIMDNGVRLPLRSTIPPVSPCAWVSFSTGMNPGRTGIFDFSFRADNSYNFPAVTAQQNVGLPFWRHLTRNGKKVGIINLPITYPVESVNGFMIACGLTTPSVDDPGFVYPTDLLSRYGLEKAAYILSPPWKLLEEGRTEELFQVLKQMVAVKTEWAIRLLREEPWDLFMIQYHATDWAGHAFWHCPNSGSFHNDKGPASELPHYLVESYRECDAAIGKLLDTLPEDVNVIVMSDHGQGPVHKTINVNLALQKLGMLKIRNVPGRELAATLVRKSLRKMAHLDGKAEAIAQVVSRLLYATIPGPIEDAIDGRVTRFLRRHINWRKSFQVSYPDLIDWPKSKAYMMGAFGCIYINLKGREPQGIVANGAEYEEVCKQVIAGLENLKDERGDRLIRKVFRKEEVFSGPMQDKAPDLIAMADDPVCYLTPNLDDEETVCARVPWRMGNHDLNGIFAMRGPDVKSGLKLASANIVDVIPTVYMMLDVPIPGEVDGRVLADCFEESFLSQHPVRVTNEQELYERRQEQEVEESEAIRIRLEGLGYI